jgi:protein phosphatase 1G
MIDCNCPPLPGDHFYKRNESITLKDQMISALPDVRVETLTDEDQFFVVACDGIWSFLSLIQDSFSCRNSMSSQQVVDFVQERLKIDMPLHEICEQVSSPPLPH